MTPQQKITQATKAIKLYALTIAILAFIFFLLKKSQHETTATAINLTNPLFLPINLIAGIGYTIDQAKTITWHHNLILMIDLSIAGTLYYLSIWSKTNSFKAFCCTFALFLVNIMISFSVNDFPLNKVNIFINSIMLFILLQGIRSNITLKKTKTL